MPTGNSSPGPVGGAAGLTRDACRERPLVRRRPPAIHPRLLRTSAAAEYLSVSPWKLRRLVHDAELPVIEGGGGANWLFDRMDLDHWIEKRKQLRPAL